MSNVADIYISYSPADNQAQEGSEGWVNHLKEFLGLFLKNLLGREVNIVLDEDGSKPAAAESFIYLVSKQHQNSDYGIGKLEEHLKKNKDADTVFKVLISNIDHASQHEALRSFYGYNLCDANEEVSTLFDNATGSTPWLRLVDLGYDLYNQIAKSSDAKSAQKSKKSVFVAEVSNDQEKNRDDIKRELQMHGYEVYPKRHLSNNAEGIIQEVNDYLSRSSLAVHIIGDNPGTLPQGSDVSIVELQNSIAAQYSEKVYSDDKISNDFTRLLWIPPDIEFENEQQRMEVEQLKQDMSALKGAEVIQTPLEMLKTIIMLRLNETFELSDDETADAAKRTVYIIYEKASQKDIGPIDEALTKSGIKTLHPIFEGDQIELINNHRVNLKECDGTLIYCNTDNLHWIESKVKELKKSPGFGKKKPFLAKAVLQADQDIVQNNKLVQENLDVIDIKGPFKAEILTPFLNKLTN